MTDPANFLFLLALLLVWCGFFLFLHVHTHNNRVGNIPKWRLCAWKGNRNVWNLHLGKKWPKKTGVQQNFTVGQLTCSRITDWPLASATSFFPTAREPKQKKRPSLFFFSPFQNNKIIWKNNSWRRRKKILRSGVYIHIRMWRYIGVGRKSVFLLFIYFQTKTSPPLTVGQTGSCSNTYTHNSKFYNPSFFFFPPSFCVAGGLLFLNKTFFFFPPKWMGNLAEKTRVTRLGRGLVLQWRVRKRSSSN
jgi:hypothetical protein